MRSESKVSGIKQEIKRQQQKQCPQNSSEKVVIDKLLRIFFPDYQHQ